MHTNESEMMPALAPLYHLEAEQSVLGAIFLDPSRIDEVVDSLESNDFYYYRNQILFDAMYNLYNEKIKIDVVTVSEILSRKKKLEDVGGIQYISEIAVTVPTAANIKYYINIVIEHSIKRKLVNASRKIIEMTYSSEEDANSILDSAERMILQVESTRNKNEFREMKAVLTNVFSNMEELSGKRGELTGLDTGFRDLNQITAGFQKTDLIIVAARPSVGKTAFAINVAQNVAKKSGENVAIFSLEMSAEQLVNRMVSATGNIDAQKIRTGQLEKEDWTKLTYAMGELSKLGIYIDDTPGVTVNEIRSKCRKLKQSDGLGMILIDYLQLIRGNPNGRKENRQQEVSEISRTLKEMAKEFKVPVIALSQLSRGVEQRQDKRPIMSDLRESGSIEQDADIVAFLYRDDYYDKESEAKNIIEIIIGKQRNGPTGTINLAFKKDYNKFLNIAYGMESI